MKIITAIKEICPPILYKYLKSIKKPQYGWFGNYNNWQEAKDDSTGYETDEILHKVRTARWDVKNGEAVYERDGVLFNTIQYSWPLLSWLMFAAAKSNGKLRVLDFGGSLGSSYFQNKKFLDKLNYVSWNVVEQKHFVDAGKKDFEDDRLHFYYDAKNCMEKENPNILLLSRVLQYIENPYELLNDIIKNDIEYVILDVVPISLSKERLTIQRIDPSIYNALYPCWLLDYSKLDSTFKVNNFSLIEKLELPHLITDMKNRKTIGKFIGEIRRLNDW